jgi:hypothetical protein
MPFRMLLCVLLGRCLRPGLLRARLRSVAFGEPSPSYPYRGFDLILIYVLGDAFLPKQIRKIL